MSFAHSIINNPKAWGRKPEPEKLDPDTGLTIWVPAPPALPIVGPAILSVHVHNGYTTYTLDAGIVAHYNHTTDSVEIVDTVNATVNVYPMAFLMSICPPGTLLSVYEAAARRVAKDVLSRQSGQAGIP